MSIETCKKLIVIGGPTASGKTSLAIQLARHFDCAILSADSRQFYKQMSIGTAKPTPIELSQAAHYFIDSLDIMQDYSVGDFERDALHLLKDLFQKSDYAILVGGSGLYHKALCEGLDEMPDVDEKAKEKVEQLFEENGMEGLQNELKTLDYDYFTKVDIANKQRVMRALSVCYSTGKTFTEFRKQNKKPRFFKSLYFCTDLARDILYKKINHRVDVMLNDGLIEEAKSLYEFKGKNALQTVGYKELFDFWDGVYPDLATAIDKIKQHSRNYAKRQITWFKHQGNYLFIPPNELDKIIDTVNETSFNEEQVTI